MAYSLVITHMFSTSSGLGGGDTGHGMKDSGGEAAKASPNAG
jgi:hypothetical protein